MERFSPGDKVTWIDQDMEGKVTSILDQNTVKVKINNGLEIEAEVTEITHAASDSIFERGRINTKKDKPGISGINKSAYFPELIEGVYLLQSQKDAQFFLINNTNNDIYWSIAKVWGRKMQTLFHHQMEKESYEKAALSQPFKVTKDLSLFVQVLFMSEKPVPLRSPVSFHLTHRSKGEKWQNHSPIPATGIKGILYRLDAPREFSMRDISVPTKEEFSASGTPSPSEVDLHIENLTRHYKKMDNAQMLRCQLNAFEQSLENAITANYLSITFIHGVGEGVLKTAIIDKLRKHPYVKRWNDASPKKYGKGATEVWLKSSLKE